MTRRLWAAALAAVLGLASQANAQFATTLFSENFNGLTLNPSVNERLGKAYGTVEATDPAFDPIPNAFSHTGPAGWTVDTTNFDNFNTADGTPDLSNTIFGTRILDQTQLPVEVEVYTIPGTGIVVGNTGISNAGDPANGVDEWEGWSFANKNFWADVAGDQGRTNFTNASGTIAVADSDEYDDLGSGLGGGYYNTGMTTASIPTNGLSSLKLQFDSAWRTEALDDNHTVLGHPDNNQAAMIWVTYSDGSRQPLVESIWDSDEGHTSSGPADPIPTRAASPFFHADNTNESVSYDVSVPNGITSVKFTFAYIDAGNDWFWGIDNLKVSDGVNSPYWTEDFESVTLGPSVNERISNTPAHVTVASATPLTTPVPNAFTNTPPANWSIDNSGMPAAGLGDNDKGVFELEGWTFTTKDFWKFAGQDAGRVDPFTKADGNLAVADSDEYDDLSGGDGLTRPFNSLLKSPVLDISGVAPGELMLKFDSNWDPEDDQTAIVTVDYGNGEVEVLHWASNGAQSHAQNHNETVLIPLNNPAGATTAVVTFKYLMAGNNWFWAVDNVAVGVGVVPEPSSVALALGTVICGLAPLRRVRRRLV